MTIALTFSMHFWFLIPRIQVQGAMLGFAWLGCALIIAQRALGGIVTPEHAPILAELVQRELQRRNRSK